MLKCLIFQVKYLDNLIDATARLRGFHTADRERSEDANQGYAYEVQYSKKYLKNEYQTGFA
jgi:hypothetical protein